MLVSVQFADDTLVRGHFGQHSRQVFGVPASLFDKANSVLELLAIQCHFEDPLLRNNEIPMKLVHQVLMFWLLESFLEARKSLEY